MQRLVQLQKELYIMNNYCKHLKKRKNKPYCNIIKKEISFSCCQECDNKEYKTKLKENSSYKKSDIAISKRTINIQNGANTRNKNKKCTNIAKMKNKSKKLAKLEHDRFSVFTDDDKCFVCDSTYQLTWNEIYRGKNRINSMQDGFCLRMCLTCHQKYQDDVEFNDYWHRQAQLYWEKNIGTRNEFLARYRRNYLK